MDRVIALLRGILLPTTVVFCALASRGDATDCTSACSPPECTTLSDDCNENQLVDKDEIAQGTAADCNDNGIPDDCDIVAGVSEDCDDNNVPDDCDLATGAVPIVPSIPGVHLANVLTVHGIEHAEGIKSELAEARAKDVTIVGGGLIGVEMTESLVAAGHLLVAAAEGC